MTKTHDHVHSDIADERWKHDGVRVIPGNQLDPNVPSTPGMDRKAAINFARAGAQTWTEVGIDRDEEHETLIAKPEAWGDVVLARKETPTSYHLSVVLDDALQGVTHVVRGEDLQAATSVHRLLQELLGLPAPHYHHHRLIHDEAGQKLSKSTQATGLRELRAQGMTPQDIRRAVGLT